MVPLLKRPLLKPHPIIPHCLWVDMLITMQQNPLFHFALALARANDFSAQSQWLVGAHVYIYFEYGDSSPQ